MEHSRSLGLKQFRKDGCISYFVYDKKSGEAALIDPHVQAMEDYRSYLVENRLKLVVACDTHIHADHFSATQLLRTEYKCEIAMSARTQSSRPTRKLKNGEFIAVGSFNLKALETPGHTADSISFFGSGLVFTGDTLLIGSTGRTDFPGADAKQQWDSLHHVLGELPGNTLIFPGHDYNDLLFSTIETEKKKNAHWKIPSLEEFLTLKSNEKIPNPDDEVKKRIQYNLNTHSEIEINSEASNITACGIAKNTESERAASISVEKYRPKLEEKTRNHDFIDVREPNEFSDGHMPGARNIPLSEVALHLDSLKKFHRLYVSCLSGRRSNSVAKTLNYIGLEDVVNVAGGFKAWVAAGFTVEK